MNLGTLGHNQILDHIQAQEAFMAPSLAFGSKYFNSFFSSSARRSFTRNCSRLRTLTRRNAAKEDSVRPELTKTDLAFLLHLGDKTEKLANSTNKITTFGFSSRHVSVYLA